MGGWARSYGIVEWGAPVADVAGADLARHGLPLLLQRRLASTW